MLKQNKIAWMVGLILFSFTACEEELSTTGVLGVEVISIPSCDRQGHQSAMEITEATKIAKQDDNTTLRVWHYQDRSKLICVAKGDAVIIND